MRCNVNIDDMNIEMLQELNEIILNAKKYVASWVICKLVTNFCLFSGKFEILVIFVKDYPVVTIYESNPMFLGSRKQTDIFLRHL